LSVLYKIYYVMVLYVFDFYFNDFSETRIMPWHYTQRRVTMLIHMQVLYVWEDEDSRKMTVVFHDEDLYTYLKVEAARRYMPASEIIADAVSEWLKDRKGRTLTYDDLTHYQRTVVALKETIRLMAEIDVLIPGWPVE